MTNDDIFAKSSTIKGAIFDQNNIIEVIDTLDYVNYSFRFVFPETPLGTFYNLVVTKTPTGEKNEPFIIKFTCKDSYLEAFLESDLDFNFFYGNYKIHKYTDYFTRGYFFKSNPDCPEKHDENGDPIPCEKEDISGGSSGGGSENEESTDGYNSGDNSNGNSNDSNSGDSDSSDGSDSGDGDSNDGNDSSNSDDSGGSSHGNDSRCAWVDNGVIYFNPDCHHNEEKFNQTKNNDDCPDCPEPIGGIGINIFAKIVQEINHYLDNSLSNSELAFLSETKNLALTTKIRDFILENYKSQEAIELAKLAIDELMSGIEIDSGRSNFVDEEPVKAYLGKVSDFKKLLDNSPRGVGKFTGKKASDYLKSLGETKFNFKQMRPLPTQTGYFNSKKRKVYLHKKRWMDRYGAFLVLCR